MKEGQRQLNIRLSPDLYRRVADCAAAEERSMAQTIRYALKRYVAAHEAKP